MATADSIKAKLQSLIAQSNAATGNTDGDLTAAIAALIAGYGSGGGNAIQIGQNENTPNFLNLFYALENGTAKTGEFTLASYLPNTETLIFDSGLSSITGIFYADADYTYTATGNTPEYSVWGLYIINPDGLTTVRAGGLSTYDTVEKRYHVNYFITRCDYRIDGGAFYVTAYYNANSNYTPFCAGHRYVWVAW